MVLILLAGTLSVHAETTKTQKMKYPKNEAYTISPQGVTQGDKKAEVISVKKITSVYDSYTPRSWELKKDISALPQLSAPGYPLLEALYNMALEEALLDIREGDQAFMAGEKWTGVWTRDISYSIHLSLGMILPENSIKSLKAKVSKDDMVIQDTGTGGSWPISTDRIVWSIAAWEIYLAHGDLEWLRYAYTVLKNTVQRDMHIAYDKKHRLYYGESSFLDWREQTYPLWMQPVDIYETRALGTSALHYQVYNILSSMAKTLEKDPSESQQWSTIARTLKESTDKNFWREDKQYYGALIYPDIMGNPVSDKAESLGEALMVLFGIADQKRAAQVISHSPMVPFGVPCIYPQHPHAGPYHNKGIWPFVEAYFLWAGARVGNEKVVSHVLQSIIRPAALFLTHKENFVYDTGHSSGTAINSDRQLWSVAGYLGSVYHVLFGLNLEPDGIRFQPHVPQFLEGSLKLSGLNYNKAVLDLSIQGKGNVIQSLKLDGQEKGASYILPPDLKGRHTITMTLTSDNSPSVMNMGDIRAIAPREVRPKVDIDRKGNVTLTWKKSKNVVKYLIYKDGKLWQEYKEQEEHELTDQVSKVTVYTIQAVDKKGIPSEISQPALAIPPANLIILEAEKADCDNEQIDDKYKSFSGKGYVKFDKKDEQGITFNTKIKTGGKYLIRVKYANGKGPINTDNKGAIRSLFLDGQDAGTFVMPQRGNWGWGYSNILYADLESGNHSFSLRYDEMDQNMNIKVNFAAIDFLELILMD